MNRLKIVCEGKEWRIWKVGKNRFRAENRVGYNWHFDKKFLAKKLELLQGNLDKYPMSAIKKSLVWLSKQKYEET